MKRNEEKGGGEGLLTVEDVAKLMSVSLSTVRMWVSRNELPCIRLGKLIRFRPDEVYFWIDERSSQRREHRGSSHV